MSSTSLRAVTHRLTTTPVQQLPQIASFLATSLSDCGELLATPQGQKVGKNDSETAIQLHKLKTRLASLLQDRTVEGRWTAVVLVKATLEAGQWEILRGYEPIVRSLIGILAVSIYAECRRIGRPIANRYTPIYIEARSCHHEENVHYHLDPHISPYLPVSDSRSRDHDAFVAGFYQLGSESHVRQILVRANQEAQAECTALGNSSACASRADRETSDNISSVLRPNPQFAGCDYRLIVLRVLLQFCEGFGRATIHITS